jgi:hypothetical protein
MKTNKNLSDNIVNDIKVCLQHMDLEILNMTKIKGRNEIKTEVDLGYLKIQLDVTYGVEEKIVTAVLEFTRRLPTKRFDEIYDLINRVNALFMDIGHFSFCPKSGKLFLRTGIDVADGSLNVSQFEKSIYRIIGQGEISYYLICRVAFDNICADEAWRDFICQIQNSASNENPTLH